MGSKRKKKKKGSKMIKFLDFCFSDYNPSVQSVAVPDPLSTSWSLLPQPNISFIQLILFVICKGIQNSTIRPLKIELYSLSLPIVSLFWLSSLRFFSLLSLSQEETDNCSWLMGGGPEFSSFGVWVGPCPPEGDTGLLQCVLYYLVHRDRTCENWRKA